MDVNCNADTSIHWMPQVSTIICSVKLCFPCLYSCLSLYVWHKCFECLHNRNSIFQIFCLKLRITEITDYWPVKCFTGIGKKQWLIHWIRDPLTKFRVLLNFCKIAVLVFHDLKCSFNIKIMFTCNKVVYFQNSNKCWTLLHIFVPLQGLW